MDLNYMNIREEIIEFLILHQPYIKTQLKELQDSKEALLQNLSPYMRADVEEQYDARIKQWISFYVGDSLGVPIENIIIELERIDLKEFLDV